MDRPDYVPANWRDGKANRWVTAKPSRVLAQLAFFLVLFVGILAWMIADPRGWTHHPAAFVFVPVAALVIVYQALKYGPRAWRAMRRG